MVASSYAYFAARIASSSQTGTSVTAKTLDSVSFNVGPDISFVANQDNFAKGKGDLRGSTTASVTFTARSDEASSYMYSIEFVIHSNSFYYTSNHVPELELTIKKNGKTWIESLDITDIMYGAVLLFQTEEITNGFYNEINYESFRANATRLVVYWPYTCMMNYYPTFDSYFDSNLKEINGGYEAFKTAICNSDISCESQLDEKYGACKGLTDEYYYQTISAEAGKTTTDTWEAIVTFKNLDEDQSGNLDKIFSGEFYIENSE